MRAEESAQLRNAGLAGRSLKTQQRGYVEVDVILGEPDHPTAEAIKGAWRLRSKSSGIPRKEVIQPQLPLRLPCYDFVPVTSPTLGTCFPCGFAQRLQVLPTSMT